MRRADGELILPDGPGFGLEVDPRQLERFDRRRGEVRPVAVSAGNTASPSVNA